MNTHDNPPKPLQDTCPNWPHVPPELRPSVGCSTPSLERLPPSKPIIIPTTRFIFQNRCCHPEDRGVFLVPRWSRDLRQRGSHLGFLLTPSIPLRGRSEYQRTPLTLLITFCCRYPSASKRIRPSPHFPEHRKSIAHLHPARINTHFDNWNTQHRRPPTCSPCLLLSFLFLMRSCLKGRLPLNSSGYHIPRLEQMLLVLSSMSSHTSALSPTSGASPLSKSQRTCNSEPLEARFTSSGASRRCRIGSSGFGRWCARRRGFDHAISRLPSVLSTGRPRYRHGHISRKSLHLKDQRCSKAERVEPWVMRNERGIANCWSS